MPSQKIFELAIAPQSAKGVAATAADFKTRVSGGDIAPMANVPTFAETGRTRLPRTAFKASSGVDGNPAMAMREDLMALLLWGALGDLATTGIADPWAHAATYANATPYFTVWRMFGDMVWEKFIDCKIAQLELVSEAEQAVVVTSTIVGTRAKALSSAVYATEVAVPYTDSPIYPHHFASGLLAFEGAVVSTIERVAVTIGNASSRQFGDSIYADDVTEGAANITIATRQRVSTPALYNRLHYGSATPASGTDPTGTVIELGAPGLDLKWAQRTAAGVAVAPARSIQITATRLQITAIAGFAPGTGDDPIRMEPTYTVFEPTTGQAITATVNNGLAATAYAP